METRHLFPLEAPGAWLDEVKRVIEFFASVARQRGTERGCLLWYAATEVAPLDPVSQGFVEAYVNRVSAALRDALEGARSRGELRDDVDTTEDRHLLASTLLRFFVLLRAQVEPAVMQGAARA